MSLLPTPDPKKNFGIFGYAGLCCDLAIKSDNAPMLSECIDRGFVDIDTRMVNGTVLEYCEKKAPRCAALLKERAVESRSIPPAASGLSATAEV